MRKSPSANYEEYRKLQKNLKFFIFRVNLFAYLVKLLYYVYIKGGGKKWQRQVKITSVLEEL